jgi:hypothetical protein
MSTGNLEIIHKNGSHYVLRARFNSIEAEEAFVMLVIQELGTVESPRLRSNGRLLYPLQDREIMSFDEIVEEVS